MNVGYVAQQTRVKVVPSEPVINIPSAKSVGLLGEVW